MLTLSLLYCSCYIFQIRSLSPSLSLCLSLSILLSLSFSPYLSLSPCICRIYLLKLQTEPLCLFRLRQSYSSADSTTALIFLHFFLLNITFPFLSNTVSSFLSIAPSRLLSHSLILIHSFFLSVIFQPLSLLFLHIPLFLCAPPTVFEGPNGKIGRVSFSGFGGFRFKLKRESASLG